MAKKKDYTVIIKHNHKERTEASEQRMQRLINNVTRELLREYPHLLNNDDVQETLKR